jgi:hypothetical protein
MSSELVARMRRWILPVLIGLALALPVVDDLYEIVRDSPDGGISPELNPLDRAELRFETRDWQIDLWTRPARHDNLAVPPVYHLERGWGQPGEKGVWSSGHETSLTVRLPEGGQRSLFLQCRPDRRGRRQPFLGVTVNDVDCGVVKLQRKLAVYRLDVPEGVLRPGPNEFEMSLSKGRNGNRPATGRTVLMRRLVLAESSDADFGEVLSRRPVKLDREAGTVSIKSPGRLLILFDVPAPASLVVFRYRFLKPVSGARCRVVVGRWYDDREAFDIIGTGELSISRSRKGSFRAKFGNHTGPSIVRITVDEGAAASMFEVRDFHVKSTP